MLFLGYSTICSDVYICSPVSCSLLSIDSYCSNGFGRGSGCCQLFIYSRFSLSTLPRFGFSGLCAYNFLKFNEVEVVRLNIEWWSNRNYNAGIITQCAPICRRYSTLFFCWKSSMAAMQVRSNSRQTFHRFRVFEGLGYRFQSSFYNFWFGKKIGFKFSTFWDKSYKVTQKHQSYPLLYVRSGNARLSLVTVGYSHSRSEELTPLLLWVWCLSLF